MDSPACGTPYDVRSSEARRLYWQVLKECPACKSAISCTARSRRRRAHTVSIGFKSPLFGGNFTDVMPCFLYTSGWFKNVSLSCHTLPMQRSHDYGIRNPKRQPSPFWTHMQPSPFRAHMQRQTQDAKFVRFENTCLTIANTNLLRANARCVAQMHVLLMEPLRHASNLYAPFLIAGWMRRNLVRLAAAGRW